MNRFIDQHKIVVGNYGDLFCIIATVCGLVIADTDSGLIACHLGGFDTGLYEYEEFCDMLDKTQTHRIFIFTHSIPFEEENRYKKNAIKISEKCINTDFYTTKRKADMITVQFDLNGDIPDLATNFNKFNYR